MDDCEKKLVNRKLLQKTWGNRVNERNRVYVGKVRTTLRNYKA